MLNKVFKAFPAINGIALNICVPFSRSEIPIATVLCCFFLCARWFWLKCTFFTNIQYTYTYISKYVTGHISFEIINGTFFNLCLSDSDSDAISLFVFLERKRNFSFRYTLNLFSGWKIVPISGWSKSFIWYWTTTICSAVGLVSIFVVWKIWNRFLLLDDRIETFSISSLLHG